MVQVNSLENTSNTIGKCTWIPPVGETQDWTISDSSGGNEDRTKHDDYDEREFGYEHFSNEPQIWSRDKVTRTNA
jgi:hypothetical protein